MTTMEKILPTVSKHGQGNGVWRLCKGLLSSDKGKGELLFLRIRQEAGNDS